MEHFWIYFRCLVILAVLGYALSYLFCGARKEENFSVNIDDIGGQTKVVEEEEGENEKPKNGKVGAGSSTARKKGGTTAESTEVTEYRSMSLKREFN